MSADTGLGGVRQAPETVSLGGTSEEPVDLSVGVTFVRISIASAAVTETGQKLYLNIENITGIDNSATYKVYVDTRSVVETGPAGEYAGLLPMFGVKEASDPGLTHVYDITDMVGRLKMAHDWNARDLYVNFVALHKNVGLPDLRVGRISLYYG